MKGFTKIAAGCACMAFVLFVGVLPAKAATLTKALNLYAKTGTYEASFDMTGDNKNDTVTADVTSDKYNSTIETIKVAVNGTDALTLGLSGDYCYGAAVYYIKMSKAKEFVQIIGYSDNGIRVTNAIYQYREKTGKLKKVLELKSGLKTAEEVVKVTSKSIKVYNAYQPIETGWVNWNYTYTFTNGKFKLKSNTAAVKSSLNTYDNGDGYFKYFKKSKFKTLKSLSFYTGTSLKKKAFTAKKGSVLQLKKIKVSGKKVYMQFKLGKKTGWTKVDHAYSDVYTYTTGGTTGGWFCGVLDRLAG